MNQSTPPNILIAIFITLPVGILIGIALGNFISAQQVPDWTLFSCPEYDTLSDDCYQDWQDEYNYFVGLSDCRSEGEKHKSSLAKNGYTNTAYRCGYKCKYDYEWASFICEDYWDYN